MNSRGELKHVRVLSQQRRFTESLMPLKIMLSWLVASIICSTELLATRPRPIHTHRRVHNQNKIQTVTKLIRHRKRGVILIY